MNQPVLEVTSFSKSYGNRHVIDNIRFTIEKGEIFGILGVNGAGKTSLLESIEGIRKYDSGDIKICGVSQEIALKNHKYGVQMQSASLPSVILVKEIVDLYCLWNQSDQAGQLMKLFDLESLAKRKYSALSTGQKRKLHLVLSLVGNPDVIFLDEPTAGLDVQARAELHQVMRLLKQEGKTIILSSHDMAEVESLCDRIGFLKDGKFHFLGSVLEFRNLKMNQFKVNIKLRGTESPLQYEIQSITNELPNILQTIISSNQEIEDMVIEKPSLEDRFLEAAKGE